MKQLNDAMNGGADLAEATNKTSDAGAPPPLSLAHKLHLKKEAEKLVGLVTDKQEFIQQAEKYCKENDLDHAVLEVAAIFESVWEADETNAKHGFKKAPCVPISAKALSKKKITPPAWILPGLIPEGLTILAGKPKCGKSWLTLDLALGVGGGHDVLGETPVQGPVLYLALEDTEARLKNRIHKIMGAEDPPEDTHFLTECPDLDGLRELVEKTEYRLMVIDTFQKFRPAPGKEASTQYAKDYEDVARLKKLADSLKIGILVVHHTRKGRSNDPFEEVSGTLGLTGAADTTLVLRKELNMTGEATLYAQGRDVEDTSMGLSFDAFQWARTGLYTAIPNANQAKAIELLDKHEKSMKVDAFHKPDGPLDLNHDATRKMLDRMAKKDLIAKTGPGEFQSMHFYQEAQL